MLTRLQQVACLATVFLAVTNMAVCRAPSAEPQTKTAPETANRVVGRFSIVIHGGAIADASKINEKQRAVAEQVLARALEIGTGVLEKDGTSLDAVEQVIRFLEDDPNFNAGRGAVFNAAGGHELDASIMEGQTRHCGAVASLKTVKNPISLARLVMSKTRHVLLVGDGAEQFAGAMKVDRVENSYFSTPEKYEELKQARAKAAEPQQHKGTVGCVALDKHGNLAAGTSTGGLTNKMFGRVGDSPIIGAGTYADNATCAVSCTGTGEEFIRHAVAYDISAQMAYKKVPLDAAVQNVLTAKLARGIGGIIAVDHDGNIVMKFNTGGMARAAADSSGRHDVRFGP
jgi:beta-aspartyl-peptidase (threonine type)